MSIFKIIKQPPLEFANQQGGKRCGFQIEVELEDKSRPSGYVRIIPDLVYSTTYESVNISEKFRSKNCKNTIKPKEILQVLSSTDFGVDGKSEMLCRINDVSRNHRSQLFRIRLTCEQGDNTETLYTRPIKVVSKHPKSKSTIFKITLNSLEILLFLWFS